jgi:hypothetical protein
MLCTSIALRPVTGGDSECQHPLLSSTDALSSALPTEHLHHVYLCAASPAVTEEWNGWPATPHVIMPDGRREAIALHDAPSTPVPLAALMEAYNLSGNCSSSNSSRETGAALVQVMAIGAHSDLSTEAKALVAGAVMGALRSHLAILLRRRHRDDGVNGDDSSTTSHVVAAATPALLLSETLQRCCRFIKQDSAALEKAASAGIFTDAATPVWGQEEGEGEGEGTWRVTWSPELLTRIAASFAQCRKEGAVTLRVINCNSALKLSVEGGARARLRQDQRSADSLGTPPQLPATSVVSHGYNKGLLSCTSVAVRMTACAPALTHPLDVQRAIELSCLLYDSHVRPAQEHGEDGTEAFRDVLKLAARLPQARQNDDSDHHHHHDLQQNSSGDGGRLCERWQRALDSYHHSAVAAQAGVLYLLTHEMSLQGGTALIPLRVAEEHARVQAAVAQQALNCRAAGTADDGLAPLRLPNNGGSDCAYVNHVLLTQQWDRAICNVQRNPTAKALMHIADDNDDNDAGEENGVAVVVAPARAALHWRTCFSSQEGESTHWAADVATALKGPTLHPTPLQWVLYTLRRQLIVAVANSAQVVLTGHRLRLQPLLPTSLSVSATRAQAARCVKAQTMLRDLVKWCCPYPVPRTRGGGGTADCMPSRSLNELMWCLRLLGKLHLRAAALYSCVGDAASQQDQLRQWQDQLHRWDSRRAAQVRRQEQQTLTECNGDAAEASPASWHVSVEDVVGHAGEAAWRAFVEEVSVGLPPVR